MGIKGSIKFDDNGDIFGDMQFEQLIGKCYAFTNWLISDSDCVINPAQSRLSLITTKGRSSL